MAQTRLTVKKNKDVEEIARALLTLTAVEVLVGVPESKAERDDTADDENESIGAINNAALAFIHDQGAPDKNIPQREFMGPGIAEAEPQIAKIMEGMLVKVLDGGDASSVEQGYHQVGLKAATSIKNAINQGIPPPLAKATLQARARRGRKGAKEELAARGRGEAPTLTNAKPLVDSGQLRNSITYAIRRKNARS